MERGDFHVRMSRVRMRQFGTGFFFSQWASSDAEIALPVGYFGRRNCTRSGVLRTQKLHSQWGTSDAEIALAVGYCGRRNYTSSSFQGRSVSVSSLCLTLLLLQAIDNVMFSGGHTLMYVALDYTVPTSWVLTDPHFSYKIHPVLASVKSMGHI